MSLVLNAQHYAAAQIEAAEEIAGRFADLGGDALIVSDLGLVDRLATRFAAPRVDVSSVASWRNAAAARLCQALGARRLILPRDVTLADATAIAEEVPVIEIEAFVLNDGCIFEEGACHTIHLPGQLGGPICLDRYRFRHRRRDGGELSARLAARLQENNEAYERWLWYRFSCGFSTTPEGLPFFTIFMAIVGLSLRHGATRATGYGFAGLGMYLAAARRQVVRADALGQLALRLNARVGDDALAAKIHQLVGALVVGWVRPFAEARDLVVQGYRLGLGTGDLMTACYNATCMILVQIARNVSVGGVCDDVGTCCSASRAGSWRPTAAT